MKTKYILYFTMAFATLIACESDPFFAPDDSGLFIKIFGNALNDSGFAVTETSNGEFLLSGTIDANIDGDLDVFLGKTDENGNRIWEVNLPKEGDQGGSDIELIDDNNAMVLGYTTDSLGNEDFLLSLVNSAGEETNSIVYGLENLNERGRFIRPSISGGFLLIGTTDDPLLEDDQDMFIVKVDNNLDTVFTRTYGLVDGIDNIGNIIETEEGNLIWCGTAEREDGKELRVVSTDIEGSVLFDLSYEEEIQGFLGSTTAVQSTGVDLQTAPGGYIITGETINSQNVSELLLMKVTKTGQFDWMAPFNQQDTDAIEKVGSSVFTSFDGSFVVSGTITKDNNVQRDDIYLAKVNQLGEILWTRSFGGENEDRASLVIETSDQGYLLLGTFEISNNSVISMIKTDSEGNTVGEEEVIRE